MEERSRKLERALGLAWPELLAEEWSADSGPYVLRKTDHDFYHTICVHAAVRIAGGVRDLLRFPDRAGSGGSGVEAEVEERSGSDCSGDGDHHANRCL